MPWQLQHVHHSEWSWVPNCSTQKKRAWSLKRNPNEGQEVHHDIFQGKRLLACRGGTSELKIWTQCLWPVNCRFFFAWHSAGSLARGYSNKQKELGVVTTQQRDCRSADGNGVSYCRRPQPGHFPPTSDRQAKCSSPYRGPEEKLKMISSAAGDNRTLHLHLACEKNWCNKMKGG